MNQSLKNVFSFIKEALELKNKNIYNLKDYEIHYDFGKFYGQFKELMEAPDYHSLSITFTGVVFRIKYLKEDKKKEIPSIPDSLDNYIFLKNGNDIISKVDDLESVLRTNGLLSIYNEYDSKIKETNRYNSLIDLYNSKYMELYSVYKRINDYEEKLEIIFGQKLMVWQDGLGHSIDRYVLEANLDLSFDPISNVISFSISNEKFRGLVTEFLNLDEYKIKDNILLNDFISEFNESDFDSDLDLNEAVFKYINYASFENEITNRELQEKEELKANRSYIFDNYGIIVRAKNSKLWIEDLNKIIGACDTTNFISPMLNLFEVDFADDTQVDALLNDPSYVDTKDDEVLFPLPSNDEQYRIVDKVKSSNIVLVQGPPGTGKSHTIANLISHYISEGKKVLVTSEKAKALEVLRDKIPEQIRSLSLSLLTSSGVDKDLEYSIASVLKRQYDEKQQEEMKKAIDKYTEKLNLIYKSKQEVIKEIIDLMSKDTISHREELNGIINFESTNELTLMDLAIWLDNNKKYRIIPLNDYEAYTYDNPRELFDKLDDIADEIKTKSYAISSEVTIHPYLNSNDVELHIKESLGYSNYKIRDEKLLNAVKQSKLTPEVLEDLEKKINRLSYLYKYFDKEWVKSNVEYSVFISKIGELLKLINDNEDFIIDTESKLFDFSLSFEDTTKYDIYLNATNEILSLYGDNDNIGIIKKFHFNSELKNLDGLKYNNNPINKDNIKKDDFNNIKLGIEYYNLIDTIRERIKQLLSIDLFNEFNIPINQFGKYKDRIIPILDGFVSFKDISKDIDSDLNKIINLNLYPISYLKISEEELKNIYEDLKYYVTENNSNSHSNSLSKEIRDYYKDCNLKSLNKMLVAIESNQLDNYIEEKNNLLHEITVINKYNSLKKNYETIFRDKKELITKYIYDFNFEERTFFKDNLINILKYHYVEKYYLSLDKSGSGLSELYERREKLREDEKKTITELVAIKGWYYQNLHMNYNISTSLNKWVNLKRKLGSGTGKNANLYLRQMREEMDTAKNAIPVWIMPIDKLIEQYPFTNEPPFDVLIMDESSQSSVFSISALSRAKKVIIVGDDKQISPSNAFTSLDEINDLRAKYLRNNTWDLQISRDTSIYDIVQTICGNKKITLTEHFRCLPEIINYSNKEFYNMEINPLKVRGKENTIAKPIKEIYVPNAVCKKTGAQVYNQTEIDRIIMLLGEIMNDPQYNNKTIGIIALLNSCTRYIQKLRELVMSKFGEEFIEERKIKIGTTYDFQGDERDVIILGMVISSVLESGEKNNFRALTTAEYDKSFNVAASRAKEQMILVHSVTLDELSPNCNRYKLLNYCLHYNDEQEKEYEKLFESTFEKDVYQFLISKGYKLIPQFKIGNYRLDFVLTNDRNQKIAIECDGDMYHSINQLENDLVRQSILERCGWKFVRIRASEFYYNRDESTQKMVDTIEHYLIGNDSIIYSANVKNSSVNKMEEKDIEPVKEQPILISTESITKEDNLVEEFLDNQDDGLLKQIELNVEEMKEDSSSGLGPSQMKYMTLYSNGVTRKDISDYYNVAYDTVKKSLQTVAEKYNVKSVDDCKTSFIKEYSDKSQYKNILDHYNKGRSNNTVKNLSLYDAYITEIRKAILEKRQIKISYSETPKLFILIPIQYYKSNDTLYLRAKDLNDNKVKLFKFEKINSLTII